MSDVATLKENYSKLRKEHKELPEFRDFTLVFGFPKAEEAESVLELFRAVKKTPFKAAHWVAGLLSPHDPICSHDSQVLKGMRSELIEAMKDLVVADKRLSMVSFDASGADDPSGEMARGLADAVEATKGTAHFLRELLEKTRDGWENAESADEEVSYRW